MYTRRRKKYSKHFQAIIGLIPVLEEACRSVLTPHPTPLSSPLCCSLTLPSLHFPQSPQPCFFPFIPTKFFPHPSYLLSPPHFSSLGHCLTLFCTICASRLLLMLTPLLLYLHPFYLRNPEARLCICAWAQTHQFVCIEPHPHPPTQTYLSDSFHPGKYIKWSSAHLIWFTHAKDWRQFSQKLDSWRSRILHALPTPLFSYAHNFLFL